jgi:hypothetical protein
MHNGWRLRQSAKKLADAKSAKDGGQVPPEGESRRTGSCRNDNFQNVLDEPSSFTALSDLHYTYASHA